MPFLGDDGQTAGSFCPLPGLLIFVTAYVFCVSYHLLLYGLLRFFFTDEPGVRGRFSCR